MGFVKLDTGILSSTLWMQREMREVFITALLMAEPWETREASRQLEVDSLKETGFEVPAGWYGLVRAAGVGILMQAGVDREAGMKALRELGEPEDESRSRAWDGRRMIRVDGGFLILNFMRYRDRDYTAAERQKRYRDRKKEQSLQRSVTLQSRDETLQSRNVTQAEAEAEAEVKDSSSSSGDEGTTKRKRKPKDPKPPKPPKPPKDWGEDAAILDVIFGEHPSRPDKKPKGSKAKALEVLKRTMAENGLTMEDVREILALYRNHPNVKEGFVQLVETFWGKSGWWLDGWLFLQRKRKAEAGHEEVPA